MRFPPGTERIQVGLFRAAAPAGLGADARRRARRLPLVRRRQRGGSAALPRAARRGARGARGDRRRGVRVGIDVAPLVQTAAGTARHVRGLAGRARGSSRVSSWSASPSAARAARPPSLATLVVPVRLGRVARDLDLLHCTTFRAPRRSRVPLVVTVHDLALLRHPEAFPAWHRRTGRRCAALGRAGGGRDRRRVGVHAGRARCRCSACRRVRVRVVPNGVDAVFTPDGPSADGELRPRRRDARAAQEPRRGRRGGADRRRRAARRRRAGLGWRRRSRLGRARRRTRSWPLSTAAHDASSTHRSTRASASPCSRRWPAGRLW